MTKWIAVNGLYVAAVYVGLWQGVGWLGIAAVGVAWLVLCAYAVLYFSPDGKARTDPAPAWLGLLVDAFTIYSFFIFDWPITAAAAFVSAILLHLIYRRPANRDLTTADAIDCTNDIALEMHVARQTAQYLQQLLELPVQQFGFSYAKVPKGHGADYLLGYIASAADAVAQSYGGKPGGNGSVNATLQLLRLLFGEDRCESLFHQTMTLNDSSSVEYKQGFEAGNKFANAALTGDSNSAFSHTMETFVKRYSICIE